MDWGTIVTMSIEGEILTYVLTAALAVSAGLVLGGAPLTTYKRTGFIPGLLIMGVVVVVGFALGARAPWMGPIFAMVSLLTSTLAAAAEKRNESAFANETFWNRVIAVLNVRRGVPLDEVGRNVRDPEL